MAAPGTTMKRKLIPFILIISLFIMIFALPGIGEQAVSDPINATISLSKTTFTTPEEVSVTIQISNVGSVAVPGSVTLFYPNGTPVTNFGDGGSIQMNVGGIQSWTGNWTVTQEELDAGSISFSVAYNVADAAGTLTNKEKPITKEIVYNKTSLSNPNQGDDPQNIEDTDPNSNLPETATVNGPKLEIIVHYAVPSIAKKGEDIQVYYTFKNTGNVDLDNITFTENKAVTSKVGKYTEVLAVGEVKTAVIPSKMGNKDIKSKAKFTYQAVGDNKKYTETSDEIVIENGTPNLTAKLEASAPGVNINEKVTLTLTLTNKGKKDYTVTSVKSGTEEVFTNLSVPAGKEVKQTKEVIIAKDMKFNYTIDAVDSSDKALKLKTKEVSVLAADPTKKLGLTVDVDFDKTAITGESDVVRALITVTNNGGFNAKAVKIVQGNTTLYTFDEINMGESASVLREFQFSQPGNYQFKALAKDSLGVEQAFASEEVYITLADETGPVDPESTPVPQAPQLVLEPVPTEAEFSTTMVTLRKVMWGVFYAMVVLIAIGLVLLLVGFVKRNQSKRKSESALDHLQRYTRRDYTAAKDEAEGEEMANPDMISDEQAEADGPSPTQMQQPATQEGIDDSELLPHEKVISSIKAQEEAQSPPIEEKRDTFVASHDGDAAILSGGTGRYRLTRPEEDVDNALEGNEDLDDGDQSDEKPRRRRADKKRD